jgi:hypothetical protein
MVSPQTADMLWEDPIYGFKFTPNSSNVWIQAVLDKK